jgi:hypothetical protein
VVGRSIDPDGLHIGLLAWGFGPAGEMPAITGLDVIVSKAGKIEALYTFIGYR